LADRHDNLPLEADGRERTRPIAKLAGCIPGACVLLLVGLVASSIHGRFYAWPDIADAAALRKDVAALVASHVGDVPIRLPHRAWPETIRALRPMVVDIAADHVWVAFPDLAMSSGRAYLIYSDPAAVAESDALGLVTPTSHPGIFKWQTRHC
jgi:hypothetical protein